jgi:large subunit ribosomal protein L24
MHVKKDDLVVVLAGKDKNKKGKILKSIPKKNRVIVEGVNVIKKHQKPNYANPEGGIIKKEAPIHVSNVLIFCESCGKGVRTKMKTDEEMNKKIRICVKCGYEFDKS